MPQRTCTVETCTRPARTRGLCNTHYSRWRLGKPLDAPIARRTTRTDEEIWRDLVEPTGFCWYWRGQVESTGYGQIRWPDRPSMQAHRWTWTQLVGPIPRGLELDHLCRNTLCVNPDHLEPVTKAENVRRGLSGFTLTGRCNNGRHDMSDLSNVYTYPNGKRQCLACLYDSRRN